ncbi:cutinase family protein [Paractinoplanes lichenicola]|uniref:Cutinase family protein n=1 Tax=Paractinoplanes lichenicola TaxID=2802976 RepID=A0ABS1VQQ3_9ACTN|nr:cutinase family protein [Actinoplanes lichenicola]MBL7256938.1 cutinase family protein [Actinoplanes lichenicola]
MESPACGDVLFVGVRGSGQNVGMGNENLDLFRALIDGPEEITAYPLPYRASPVSTFVKPGSGRADYLRSVGRGVRALERLLEQRTRDCPDERLVLSGFSQGAMVIHRVLQRARPATLEHIVAVALMADGDRTPGDRAVRLGSAAPEGRGIAQTYAGTLRARRTPLPAWPAVFSLCSRYDLVCDFTPLHLHNGAMLATGFLVHLGYGPAEIGPLAQRVQRALAR